jgi:thiosulfate/3-mercaptopyruvate sulfurtransferase
MSGAPAGSGTAPVIDVAGLTAALAGSPRPALLDVRWCLVGPSGRESYRAGHLSG